MTKRTRQTRALQAVMIHALLVTALLAPLASAIAADPDFPPELTTRAEKMAWIREQAAAVNRETFAEMAKPRAEWSRAALEALAERGLQYNKLIDKVSSALPWERIEAKEALKRLDAEARDSQSEGLRKLSDDLAEVERLGSAERAKPMAEWSRSYLEELAARGKALRTKRYELDAGVVAFTPAEEGLAMLDRATEERERQRLTAEAEAKEAAAAAVRAKREREQAAAGKAKAAKDAQVAAQSAAEKRRQAAIATGATPEQVRLILDGHTWIGMSPEQAHVSWGQPRNVTRYTTAAGTTEHWSYDGGGLVFTNAKLTLIRN